MTLSEKIVYLRRQKNWSQEELASRLDVARQSISKWESGLSVPELDKLVSMSEIFGVTLDCLIKDVSDGETEQAKSADTPPAPPRVSADTVAEFLAFRKKSAWMIALGVLLCVLSPVCLILLSAHAEEGFRPLPENVMVLLGLIFLFAFVVTAVVLFVISGLNGERYAFLAKGDFTLDAATIASVTEQKEAMRSKNILCIAIAIGLCILSGLPLICFSLLFDRSVLIALGVVILLLLAGLGATLFTFTGVRLGGYHILLREGDYTPDKKNSRTEAISSAYWLLVTAIYLTVSFIFDNWHISWVIWVAAAILFGALEAVLRAFLPIRKDGDDID